MKPRRRNRFLREERGNNLIEFAFLLPFFMVLILGAVDFGRYYYFVMEVSGAAQAAAEYGALNPQSTSINTAGNNDAPEVKTSNSDVTTAVAVTSSSGCECSDGTAFTASNCSTSPPSCTYNVVYVVKATATATFAPIVPWNGVMFWTNSPSSITVTAKAAMRSGSAS